MMPRLTADQWATIRAEREASGRSFRELSAKYNVSDAAIVKRAKSEGWSDGANLNEAIRRKVSEKVSGVDKAVSAEKKAKAIDEEAGKIAAIIERHRQEWPQIVALRQEAIRDRVSDPSGAYAKARLAKVIAETTKIQQEGERKAWGMDASLSDREIEAMSIEEIEERLRRG